MPLELPPSAEVGASLSGLVRIDVPIIFEKLIVGPWIGVNFRSLRLQPIREISREAANLVHESL